MSDLIFEHRTIKSYLNACFRTTGEQRGRRGLLAAYLKCGSSFVSQVLTQRANFSREQALKVSRFLSHSIDEEIYFMAMFDSERAGSKELRDFQEKMIKNLLEKRNVIQERLKSVQTLQENLNSEYYESWHFAAIHMATALPTINTVEDIAHFTRIEMSRVKWIVEWLIANGLVNRQRNRLTCGNVRVHIGADSRHVLRHHANWRLKTTEQLQVPPTSTNLHYTSCLVVSHDFKAWLRSKLLNLLQEAEPEVLNARDETLLHFGFDLYSI